MDYLFKRIENLPNDYNHIDPNAYMPVIEYKTRTDHLEIIQKRISRYAMQIEAIIKQCSVDNSKNVNMKSKNLNNVIDEIIKLSDLMKSGVISE
jgi:hypothetical protein